MHPNRIFKLNDKSEICCCNVSIVAQNFGINFQSIFLCISSKQTLPNGKKREENICVTADYITQTHMIGLTKTSR